MNDQQTQRSETQERKKVGFIWTLKEEIQGISCKAKGNSLEVKKEEKRKVSSGWWTKRFRKYLIIREGNIITEWETNI